MYLNYKEGIMIENKFNFNPGSLENMIVHQSRLEIEYLRRLYGKATDLIGMSNNKQLRREGIKIYKKIFSPNAIISAGAEKILKAKGPDGWVKVVINALDKYDNTQHLIGTQVVEFSKLNIKNKKLISGEAKMTSYLQAWHAWSDNRLRVVMGTYNDNLRFKQDSGWQIYKMHLEHTSTDHRMVGKTFE